ncbi:uncharacterized protein PFLUO_LOCUS3327 [Penicillium psychrofluorescens]|uniref:uncharacterized protein n=1 Tax=Penicillium psychrofluorescens TaxID=3158075 RepID=UPI003CCE51AB
MITGIAHINLTIPAETLAQAEEFYGGTLQLQSIPVPELQRGTLAWFNIGTSGQQVHISFGTTDPMGTRHPCFKLGSREDLERLKTRIYEHYLRKGPAAPMAADVPGEMDSGMYLFSSSGTAEENVLLLIYTWNDK